MKQFGFVLLAGAIFFSSCENLGAIRVEDKHGEFKNPTGFNSFLKDVQDQTESKLTFIRYGVEGQRSVEKITYDGDSLKVHQTVDKKFIVEYKCKGIEKQNKQDEFIFVLTGCRDSLKNIELVTVPVEKMKY